MLIYVLDDGETWTLEEPTPVAVTPEQLTRIEDGEKVYNVVPDWDERPELACNCIKCTTARTASRDIVAAQNEATPTDALFIETCRYCGGNCPNEPDDSEHLCDGFAGDIDGLCEDDGGE